MQINKKYLVIALLFIYLFTLTISTIGFVHASEIYDYIIPTGTATLSGGYQYNLMLDDDTPLTLGFLRDNPDYQVSINPSGGNTSVSAVFTNGSTGSIVNTSSSGTIPYIITYNSYIQNLHDRYGDVIWDYPVRLSNNGSTAIISINSNYIYNSDGTITNPDEIPEETTPVVPPEDDGEDTAGLLDSLLNGIKEFFSDLFSPILSFIEDVQDTLSSTDKLLGWFNSLYEKIKGYTMKPVLDFFEDLTQNDAVALVLLFWDFPFVKQFTLAVVAVLIVSGLFRLLNSL